jgi:hypothetical protein
MERILLRNDTDLRLAIEFFGTKYKTDIKFAVDKYPCLLIGNYSEDVEFGNGYEFASVYPDEFEQELSGKVYY